MTMSVNQAPGFQRTQRKNIDTAFILAFWPLRRLRQLRPLRLLRAFMRAVACVALDGNQTLASNING